MEEAALQELPLCEPAGPVADSCGDVHKKRLVALRRVLGHIFDTDRSCDEKGLSEADHRKYTAVGNQRSAYRNVPYKLVFLVFQTSLQVVLVSL